MFGIKTQLKKARHEAMPSRAFKSQLLKQLQSEMKTSSMPNASLFARYGAVGVTSFALLLGAGTSVYAYESPSVIEGHPLQVVKQNLENVEGKLANWKGKPAEFHAKMAERRLNEVEKHKDQKEKVDALLTAAATELGMTLEELQQGLQNDETRAALITRMTASDAVVGGLVQRFVDRVEEHEPGEGPRQEWLEKAGLGDEISAIRAELKDSTLSNEEKQEVFHEKMKTLLDEQKTKIDARRTELKAQGLEDEAVREQLHDEFDIPPGGFRGMNGGMGAGKDQEFGDEEKGRGPRFNQNRPEEMRDQRNEDEADESEPESESESEDESDEGSDQR